MRIHADLPDVTNRLIEAYRSVLVEASARDAGLRRFIDALAAIDTAQARNPGQGVKHPALQHFGQAIETMRGDTHLASAIREIAAHLVWAGSYGSGGACGRCGRNGLG
jgi:hypothetical protein